MNIAFKQDDRPDAVQIGTGRGTDRIVNITRAIGVSLAGVPLRPR